MIFSTDDVGGLKHNVLCITDLLIDLIGMMKAHTDPIKTETSLSLNDNRGKNHNVPFFSTCATKVQRFFKKF